MAVGPCLLSQEGVNLAVEEQENRAGFEVAHLLPVPDREAGGDPTHVANLEIEQDDGGIDVGHGGNNIDASPYSEHPMSSGHRSVNLIEQGVGVGGEKNVDHGRMVHPDIVRPTVGRSQTRVRKSQFWLRCWRARDPC